jgi:phage portal protein BeeE
VPVEQLPVAVGLANLHADVLAAMPMTTTAGRRGTQPDVVTRPNPEETRHATQHKLVQSIFWTGNGYGLRGNDSAIVLNPNEVSYDPDPYDSTRIVQWYVNGQPVEKSRIVHVKLNDDPRRGPLGRSPLSLASEPLQMYGYAYGYLSMFFAGGGNPSTVLRRTGPSNAVYEPAQAAEDWIEARKARRPAVLPAGWELQVPTNNGEMEAVGRILEQCAVEVARLVNAPPSLVNAKANGSMTYSNVHGEIARWLSLSLVPTWITRLEDFWSDLTGYPIELDTDVMFRLVSPTDTGAIPAAGPMPRLEAVA